MVKITWFDEHHSFQGVLKDISSHFEAIQEELELVEDGKVTLTEEDQKNLEYLYDIAENTYVVGSRGEWKSPQEYTPVPYEEGEWYREAQFFFVKNWTNDDWDEMEKIQELFDERGSWEYRSTHGVLDFKSMLLSRKAFKITKKRDKEFVGYNFLRQKLTKYEERTGRSSLFVDRWKVKKNAVS